MDGTIVLNRPIDGWKITGWISKLPRFLNLLSKFPKLLYLTYMPDSLWGKGHRES